MTPAEGQVALLLFDALLTAAERIAEKIQQARREGVITVEEQSARLSQVDVIREKVGLPKPPTS